MSNVQRQKHSVVWALSDYYLFPSSHLSAAAGADKLQIVVLSDSDASWFDPLNDNWLLCCSHFFFRAQKCVNRKVLLTQMKIKIHTEIPGRRTNTHSRSGAHPQAPNHEWEQTPTRCRYETRLVKKRAQDAASFITWAVTSLDLQTPAWSVFSSIPQLWVPAGYLKCIFCPRAHCHCW